jgi:hypothetical protein
MIRLADDEAMAEDMEDSLVESTYEPTHGL